MFQDDLLIWHRRGMNLRPKENVFFRNCQRMLPRLDRLLSGDDFDPQAEETTFRVAVTDHASHVLCPLICRIVLPGASKVSIEFVSFGDHTFDAIESAITPLMRSKRAGSI
jgi:DNA-binding transcriptional LysR family regulator